MKLIFPGENKIYYQHKLIYLFILILKILKENFLTTLVAFANLTPVFSPRNWVNSMPFAWHLHLC